MSQGELGLQDTDFWTDPYKTTSAKTTDLQIAGFRGTILDAPKVVPLDQRKTVPLVALRVASFVDAVKARFTEVAVLTAVDRHENRFYAAMAVEERPNVVDDGFDPNEPIPDGSMGETFIVELQERLPIPLTAGRELIVTLVLRDKTSNRVRIELATSDATYEDAEVEKYVASQRALVEPPPIVPTPGTTLPTYRPIQGSPEIPAELGISLSIDRVIVAEPTTQLIVRGSFRLPREDARLVRPEHHARFVAPVPTAVVRVALMITGSEVAAPFLVPITVPSYDDAAKIEASGQVTGHFAFDLMQFGNLKRRPQTYFVYAFCGEVMAGPAVMGLVPPGRLPRP